MAEAQRRVATQATESFGGSTQGAAASSVTNVLLLTSDDELWIQLKDLAGPAYNIQQADSIEQTVESWPAGQAGIFVWDIRSEQQVNRGLTKLQHHSASLVSVVIDTDPAREMIAGLLRQRSILGRLTLPLADSHVSTALETAREEANARAALFGTQGTSSAGSSGGLPTRLIAAIAAVVLLGGVGVYWWLSHGSKSATAAATAATAAGPAAAAKQAAAGAAKDSQTDQVEPLLAKAREAMRDKRYDEPENDCALAYYKNVLLFDASNGEARQGLDRIAEVLLMRAQSAFEQRNYDLALRSIETARSIRPDHPRLAALDAQIGQRRGELALAQIQAAMQAQSFDRAQQLMRQAQQAQSVPQDVLARVREELGRRQAESELTDTLKLLQTRLQQGRLVEPENDSAKYYLGVARRKPNAANNTQLQSLAQDLTRAILQEARAAAGRQASAEVDRWLGEARDLGAPARDIQAVQREFAQQTQKPKIDSARTVQLVSDRISQGRLIDPPNDSAVFYLSSLKTADARNTALPDLTRRVVAELLNAARAALDGNRIADADSALQSARTLGAAATDMAPLEQRVAHAKALAAQRNTIVSAGALKLTRPISPTYPEDALRKGIEGWVELQFTVDADGKVSDVEVTASEPKNVFDRAAVSAMKHARYEPVLVDGQAVAQKAHFRIAFRVSSKN